MIQNILKSMHTKFGKYLISVLLGLGLASIFRRSCRDHKCLVFRAPPLREMTEGKYQHGGKCYRYTTHTELCSNAKDDIVAVE